MIDLDYATQVRLFITISFLVICFLIAGAKPTEKEIKDLENYRKRRWWWLGRAVPVFAFMINDDGTWKKNSKLILILFLLGVIAFSWMAPIK